MNAIASIGRQHLKHYRIINPIKTHRRVVLCTYDCQTIGTRTQWKINFELNVQFYSSLVTKVP